MSQDTHRKPQESTQETQQNRQAPEPAARRKRSPVLRLLGGLLALISIIALGLGAYAVYQANQFLTTPPESPGEEVIVIVEPGATFSQAARLLEERGVIANSDYFQILGRYRNATASIRAGEFPLHTGWTPDQVLEALLSGRQVLHRLSLREGLTLRETAQAVESSGYADAASVLAAAADPELLKRFNVPYDTAEGFLFPETYFLERSRAMDGQYIVELLLTSFWNQTAHLWPEGGPSADELKRIVTLASIVEKETGAPDERRKVAGVYANRLERRMLLQSDPTTIYGLGEAFDGNLKRSHLEDRNNPYNTYRHAGLPPGPICSPGLAALEAAVNPEEHKYLYFVSKKDGTHYFSKSLKEHNRAVRKYQLGR